MDMGFYMDNEDGMVCGWVFLVVDDKGFSQLGFSTSFLSKLRRLEYIFSLESLKPYNLPPLFSTNLQGKKRDKNKLFVINNHK